ncbi:hypothetical protein VB711_01125 [Cronbergia sp. UHCC 0137]|uniref:hypothetical protein n=1 Tax=Cronbergia sp. UHCC 0137 TaxID=3110239 RepID=UPI002B1FD637|nr:hypothetical protein [Cronbergia sp. UHCC 0137]MEA5616446.1 hypothetical protein [Cronbergia sp. UHCC 0137]
MLLITADQVQYCQLTYTIDDELQTIDGMSYRDMLFIKVYSFPKEQRLDAVEKAKFVSLENKGRFLVILVEENENYVIWQQTNQAQIKVEQPQEIPISEIDLEQLVAKMRNVGGIKIEDRRYKLKIYPRCFIGNEAVIWLMESLQLSQENAIRLGQRLIDEKWIHHVTDDHSFKNEYLFYRFYWDEK